MHKFFEGEGIDKKFERSRKIASSLIFVVYLSYQSSDRMRRTSLQKFIQKNIFKFFCCFYIGGHVTFTKKK